MKDKITSESPIVQIDENNLDKECIRLPSDYLKYAHESVEAKHNLDEARARLSVAEADLAKAIRADPSKFGIEKATNDAVKEAIECDARCQKRAQMVRDFQYEANLAEAVVWALEHKKRSITNLIELHGMGYFSNPKISGKGKMALEEMEAGRGVRRRRQRDEE